MLMIQLRQVTQNITNTNNTLNGNTNALSQIRTAFLITPSVAANK